MDVKRLIWFLGNGGSQTFDITFVFPNDTFEADYRSVGVTLPTVFIADKVFYWAIVWNSNDSKWDIIGVGQQS